MVLSRARCQFSFSLSAFSSTGRISCNTASKESSCSGFSSNNFKKSTCFKFKLSGSPGPPRGPFQPANPVYVVSTACNNVPRGNAELGAVALSFYNESTR